MGCKRAGDTSTADATSSDTFSANTLPASTVPTDTAATQSLDAPPRVDEGPPKAAAQADLPSTPNITANEDSRIAFVSLSPPASAIDLRVEAGQLVADLVKQFPGSTDALEVKARFHLLVGENNLAKRCWEQALAIDPNFGYAQHGLGKVAMLQADYATAIQLLMQAKDKLPAEAEPVHNLSDAYLKLGDVAAAIQVLEEFSSAHQDSGETLLLLGQAYVADRQFEKAKQAFEQTLTLHPDSPRAQEGLAKTLIRLGDREAARELLEKQRELRKDEASNRSPDEVFRDECKDYSHRYLYAARVYLAGRMPIRAEQILRKATILDPANTDAWTQLLTQLQRQGQLQQAVESAVQMCQDNPTNAGCFFTCGILQAKAGQHTAASESLKKVIQLAPQSFSGYEALARLQIQIGPSPETIDLANKVVELRGIAADHELLAQAYAANEKLEQAEGELKKAIQLDPQNTYYADALRQLQQYRKTAP